MDLDEWEFLPTDGFIDLDQDPPQEKIFLGKRDNPQPKSMLDMDYFICPSSPPSRKSMAPSPSQLVHLPLLPSISDDDDTATFVKQITKLPNQLTPPPPADHIVKHPPNMMRSVESDPDQDGVSQVSFKKKDQLADMKIEKKEHDQLADMKIGSPRAAVGRVILPQVDTAALKFDTDQTMETKICTSSPRKMMKGEGDDDELDCCDGNNGGFDLWKWSLTGIGAICSFGVAAATMFIVILGTNNHRNKKLQHTQKLRFEIYDDKRIKEVVQQASKWNEAIFAVRGVPMNRAPVSFGAHYDGL